VAQLFGSYAVNVWVTLSGNICNNKQTNNPHTVVDEDSTEQNDHSSLSYKTILNFS